MYLYKLPEPNQYMFVKKRSLYHLYKPKDIQGLLLITEKFYKKYEKHFGIIDTKQFRYSALEQLKTHFINIFTDNQLNIVHKTLIAFFINQFNISKEQYSESLQRILTESHSFEIQVQLSKYQSIKSLYPKSLLLKIFKGLFYKQNP